MSSAVAEEWVASWPLRAETGCSNLPDLPVVFPVFVVCSRRARPVLFGDQLAVGIRAADPSWGIIGLIEHAALATSPVGGLRLV